MITDIERLASALAGRYRIEREIGAGGMATVYLAHDLRHGREVAIKVLQNDLAGLMGAERFLREIAVTARLDHANILPLLDSGNADDLLYYVMPYVRGESLRDRLARERQLPIADALQIARDVSAALSYAHDLNVVHRDVKPENILLSGGHARVADFGIARALNEVGGNTITGTGIIIGSPAYMSPEQAAGERDIDGRSDQYALGCVLYEMLAGQPPFSGPTQESIIRQHLVAGAPDVSQLRPTVPSRVVSSLTRALAKAPADRFQSLAEFSSTLVDVETTRADNVTAAPKSAPYSNAGRASRLQIAGAALLLIALVAAPVMILVNRRAATTTADTRPLVAVLPFRNIGSANDEYFADGLTEEITSRLSTISGIGTISRTTALTYKGSTKALKDIARELGVAYILEGTVRTERLADGTGQVRVTPELVRAGSDTPLWTDRLTASLAPGELFAVQAQIAERVASAFNVSLLDRERVALRRSETVDRDAHNAYLQGRFSLAKSTEASLLEAIAFFSQAVAKDSTYARAYAGLSDAFGAAPYFPNAGLEDADVFAKAMTAARRAVRLDSTMADGHAALASVLADGYWQWADAERELEIAIRLDPDNASARARLATLLLARGKNADALAQSQRALQLEPASPGMHHNMAAMLSDVGKLDEAVAQEQAALSLNPDYVFAHVGLGEIAALRNDIPGMGRELQKLPPLAAIGAAMTTITTDPRSRRSTIEAIRALHSANPGLDAGRQGWLFAAIGEKELALDAFDVAIRSHSPGGLSAFLFPTVRRALGSSARYQSLLKTAGLPVH